MSSPDDDGDDRVGTDAGNARAPDDRDNAIPDDPTTADGDGSGPAPDEWRSHEIDDRPPQHTERETESEWQLFFYDLVSSVLAVMVVGAYLFAISGVWPPLVAVESESMVPNMEVNDLVFVMEEERFPGENAHSETGVVTAQAAADGDREFGQPGDVIVFRPDGSRGQTPIIHRAMFWVEEGENWYDRADKDYVGGADACQGEGQNEQGLRNCPAPHAGFITKGDNNGLYDQAGPGGAKTAPVKPEWIVGTAEVRIPGLGWVRLATQ